MDTKKPALTGCPHYGKSDLTALARNVNIALNAKRASARLRGTHRKQTPTTLTIAKPIFDLRRFEE